MAEQAQRVKPTAGAAPVVQVEQLADGVLQALGTSRTLSSLPAVAAKAAEDLAKTVNIENTDVLFKASEKPRAEMVAISQQMIGDTKLGDVEPLSQLFSRFANVEKDLDVQSVHEQPGFFTALAIKVFGKSFEPLYRFLERYRKVEGVIAEQEAKIMGLHAKQTTSKEQMKALKKRTLDNFQAYEIMIAAGEIVLERERALYNQEVAAFLASDQKDNVAMLARFKDRRTQLTRLDTRIAGMQVVRADTILDFEVLDIAIANADNLRQTLHDIQMQTIPQLYKAVAIAVQVYGQRMAAKFSDKVRGQVTRLRDSNIKALGMAQEEVHNVTMRHAQEADAVAKAMEDMANIVRRGTELMKATEEINKKVRQVLNKSEAGFKEAMEADLREAVQK